MRVLLSYPSEFDKGEGVHVAGALRRLGHEVLELNVAASATSTGSPGRVVRGYPADVSIQELTNEHGPSDLLLYVEPIGLIPIGLESSPIPTACIIADPHRSLVPR